jgi:hypothetical protein
MKNIVEAMAELGGVNVWLAIGGPSPKDGGDIRAWV